MNVKTAVKTLLRSTALRSTALVAAFSMVACADEKLVAVDDEVVKTYDDIVDIEAEFCTRTAQEVTFPVKILLVLDGSGSLQFTDQSGTRRSAVRDLMSSLATQPDVFVATMVFGSNVYVDPPISPGAPAFISAADWVEPPFLGVADIQTNYHGALSAVQSHILMDMLDSDPAEISRTKYVVLFFSDGAPTPKCCLSAEETVGFRGELPFGCAPEPYETDVAGTRYCEGEEEQTLCNDTDWLDNFRDINNTGEAPDYGDGTLDALNELEPNDNYNRTYQLEDLVREMVELGETFGVGEFRFHTTLLFDSTLPDGVKEIYRLNRCRSAGLLSRMADLGNGVFRDFESSEEIDFLSFNFTSLKRGYSLIGTYAHNQSALPSEGGFLPDTDGDGLLDITELELGTDSTIADSDRFATQPNVAEAPTELDPTAWGDGYNDKIEQDLRNVGFDPRYQSLPISPCPLVDLAGIDQSDLDADGLNGCEEYLFETDPERADSDGDGLSDGLEVRLGLDPAWHEGSRDDDFDGLENLKEVRRGSDPFLPDANDRDGLSYRYELIERGETDDGRRCYTSKMNGIRLVTTEPRAVGGGSGDFCVANGDCNQQQGEICHRSSCQILKQGYNDVYVWIAESPTDNPTGNTDLRFACYRAQYIEPSYKAPPNGKITLFEEDFWDLADPEDVALLSAGTDPCRGRSLTE